jgi:predicted nucleotidyltransferase
MASEESLKTAIAKAQKFLSLLKAEQINYSDAYLFGSYSNGTAREDSDIDIALISKQWMPDVIDARFKLMKIACSIDSRIEPHPIDNDMFISGEPFSKEIINTGRKIFPE